jgi:hypothetical protein
LNKERIFSIVLAAIIVIGAAVFYIYINGSLSEKVSTYISENEEETIYDIDNVMSYYVESISIEGTLINEHFNLDDEDVNCLSCHDIDTLRELYLQCNTEENDKEGQNMEDSLLSYVLSVIVHTKELAQLTAGSQSWLIQKVK